MRALNHFLLVSLFIFYQDKKQGDLLDKRQGFDLN